MRVVGGKTGADGKLFAVIIENVHYFLRIRYYYFRNKNVSFASFWCFTENFKYVHNLCNVPIILFFLYPQIN